MAIEVSVVGQGSFKGSSSNLSSYSVEEVATPIEASQGSPGVGTISFGAVETADSIHLLDNRIELRDGARGVISGFIRSLQGTDGVINVTADSQLSVLMAERVSTPQIGTFQTVVTYYLSLLDITSGFEFDPDIASLSVLSPSWNKPVIDAVSELCVVYGVEVSVVFDRIVFRAIRSNTAVLSRLSSTSVSLDRGNPALSVEMNYYNYRQATDVVLPSPLERELTGFQVNPGETLDPIILDAPASLTSVSQPSPTTFLPPNYTGGSSYTVIGSDDLPIPPAEWTANGGRVRVEVNPENRSQVIVHVTGMRIAGEVDGEDFFDYRAPYRVGVLSSSGGAYYNAFYVWGTGLFFDKQKLTVFTGASHTQETVGVEVDNPFVSTRQQALTAIARVVKRYSGCVYTVSGSAVSVNRVGAGSEFATAKLSAFNAEFSGQKLSALDGRNWKFSDFDAHYAALVVDQFENQLFGNASGARVHSREAVFRISNANTDPSEVSFDAELDTLFSDWDSSWSGKKLADWDAEFSGFKMRDWDIRPLKGVA